MCDVNKSFCAAHQEARVGVCSLPKRPASTPPASSVYVLDDCEHGTEGNEQVLAEGSMGLNRRSSESSSDVVGGGRRN